MLLLKLICAVYQELVTGFGKRSLFQVCPLMLETKSFVVSGESLIQSNHTA